MWCKLCRWLSWKTDTSFRRCERMNANWRSLICTHRVLWRKACSWYTWLKETFAAATKEKAQLEKKIAELQETSAEKCEREQALLEQTQGLRRKIEELQARSAENEFELRRIADEAETRYRDLQVTKTELELRLADSQEALKVLFMQYLSQLLTRCVFTGWSFEGCRRQWHTHDARVHAIPSSWLTHIDVYFTSLLLIHLLFSINKRQKSGILLHYPVQKLLSDEWTSKKVNRTSRKEKRISFE